ncbi:MAG: ROK family protein, partial [Bacteroidota bacterium]|nr:ROK family protein [Bacteroidota bacterium]
MILGIDVGGTTTKMGLVQHGSVICHGRIETTGHVNEHAFADAIADQARRMCEGNGTIEAIGVGAPNGNQHSGAIEKAANLPWKNEVPLAKMLADRLKVPCVLGNDANAAALGEWRYGSGRNYSDLLVATLGTGLGSGFIIDGKLLIGPFGNAGELGHITVVMDGRSCGCGRNGCLEPYVNISGIRQTYAELSIKDGGGGTDVLNEEGVRPIGKAAMEGDPIALKTFDRTARWLAIGLANAVAITTPQLIVLFGGITRNGDLLMGPLRRYFEPSLMPVFRNKIELR